MFSYFISYRLLVFGSILELSLSIVTIRQYSSIFYSKAKFCLAILYQGNFSELNVPVYRADLVFLNFSIYLYFSTP
jgi:hypothetical protein